MRFQYVSGLNNSALLHATEQLVRSERRTAAEVVVHLAEIEARQLHLARGFSCLRDYCMQVLGLSEYEAFARIEAARAGRRFPRVFEMLLEGLLSLTTAQLLARRLTDENHHALLADATARSKIEVERLLARRFPQPDVPDSTRKLPTPRASVVSAPASLARTAPPADGAAPAVVAPPSPAPARALIAPLAPDRYKITFTADTETTELLEFAKDMLSHAVPSGETAEVVKRALKSLIRDLARKKFGMTDRPRASKRPRDDRDIPASVKCEVWVRDGGRCAFVGTDGRRCGSRRYVQFHHLDERSNGGKGTAKNLQLRCGPHNRYESRHDNGVPKRVPHDWPLGMPSLAAGAPSVGAPPTAARPVARSGPSEGSLPVVSGAIRGAAGGAPCPPAT